MIEKRPFGRTGHLSTATLFGGAALARANQADADRTLELLLRHGVNHIDTAARYGDSELRIGPWMARHRKDFFLATKTGSRSAREAREDIHRSLDRLRVDHVQAGIERGPEEARDGARAHGLVADLGAPEAEHSRDDVGTAEAATLHGGSSMRIGRKRRHVKCLRAPEAPRNGRAKRG